MKGTKALRFNYIYIVGVLFLLTGSLLVPEGIAQNSSSSPEDIYNYPEFEAPVLTPTHRVQKARNKNQTVIDVLDLKNMDVLDVMKLISQKSGINIVPAQNVRGKVTIYLKDIEVYEALSLIVDAYGWAYVEDRDVIKIMTAQDYENKYGHKFGKKIHTRIKQIMFANANDLVAILNQVKSALGKVISDDKTGTLILIDEYPRLEEMELIITKIDVPYRTEVFELTYASVEDISGKITEVLTPGLGNLKFDERSNKIIVSDTPLKINEIRHIIEAFDQKDREVNIEAKIIQIALNNEHKLGVDWEAIVSDYHALNLKSDLDVLSASEKSGRLSIGTLDNDDYTFLIEALDTVGSTDILSSPRITALNNKEAKILVGSTEPYVTSTTTTPSSGPTTTAESVNFIEVGVKLFVTPTIHKDGFITMKIKPEVSSVVDNVTTSNNNTIPVVETSEAETTVMVRDGVTIVIGGLIKEESLRTTKTIPVLGKLPVLGMVFKSEDERVGKTELVIFLTPIIVTGDVDEDIFM